MVGMPTVSEVVLVGARLTAAAVFVFLASLSLTVVAIPDPTGVVPVVVSVVLTVVLTPFAYSWMRPDAGEGAVSEA